MPPPPAVAPAANLPPVNVVELLLIELVDLQLRLARSDGLDRGAAFGLFGTTRSPCDVLADALAHPLKFALARLLEFRRELRIEVAGLITGPRATGWWIASFGQGLALPDAIAAVGPPHRRAERPGVRHRHLRLAAASWTKIAGGSVVNAAAPR